MACRRPGGGAGARRPLPEGWRDPLVDAPGLAAEAGVGTLLVKDERDRMGLGSFKALGAAHVIARDAAEGRARGRTYVTASAGNHGLSVAAGAAAFGAHARIFLADTVPESFADRLQGTRRRGRAGGRHLRGQHARRRRRAAEAEGLELLSDSSWPGYMDRPKVLMEGYLVLMAEVAEQIGAPPTHVFLQAGVGGLAGAAAAFVRATWGDGPRIVVVEPAFAPGAYRVDPRRRAGGGGGAGFHHGAARLQGALADRAERSGAGRGRLRDHHRGRGGARRDARGGPWLAPRRRRARRASPACSPPGRRAEALGLGPEATGADDPDRSADAMSPRGFPEAEYRARVAQGAGGDGGAGLAALLLTTEPDVRYFTGFLTRFWESPTRPWFLVVPAAGDPSPLFRRSARR